MSKTTTKKERKEYTDEELEKGNWCYLCHRDFDQQRLYTSTFYYQDINANGNMVEFRFCQDCAHDLVENIFTAIVSIGDKRNE